AEERAQARKELQNGGGNFKGGFGKKGGKGFGKGGEPGRPGPRVSVDDVAATLIVDGKRYPNVGVHFRGMSSYGMVPAGSKRSLNVSLDMADAKQRLQGYKTLNLLNGHEDGSQLSTVLYSHIARQYLPAP